MGKNHNKGGIAGRRALKRRRVDDVMMADVDALSRPNVLVLLAALRARLIVLTSSREKSPAKKVWCSRGEEADGGRRRAEKEESTTKSAGP